MKLERINAAAQMEFPNARPLNRSQSVSKISATIPDRKRMAERTATGTLTWTPHDRAPQDTCVSGAGWDLVINTKTRGNPQGNASCDLSRQRAANEAHAGGPQRPRLAERQH